MQHPVIGVQHHDGAERHWYSWFSSRGAEVKQGKSYEISYTLGANKAEGGSPYRNIQNVSEPIETPPETQAAANAAPANGSRDELFRSKEELRRTEAVGFAVSVVTTATMDLNTDEMKEAITDWTLFFEGLLQDAPEAAPTGVDAKTDPEPPQQRKTPPKAKQSAAQPAAAASEKPGEPGKITEEQLRAQVDEAGMDWEDFERDVLETTWADWTSKGGQAYGASRRWDRFRESHRQPAVTS